jgi:hypothetical protein
MSDETKKKETEVSAQNAYEFVNQCLVPFLLKDLANLVIEYYSFLSVGSWKRQAQELRIFEGKQNAQAVEIMQPCTRRTKALFLDFVPRDKLLHELHDDEVFLFSKIARSAAQDIRLPISFTIKHINSFLRTVKEERRLRPVKLRSLSFEAYNFECIDPFDKQWIEFQELINDLKIHSLELSACVVTCITYNKKTIITFPFIKHLSLTQDLFDSFNKLEACFPNLQSLSMDYKATAQEFQKFHSTVNEKEKEKEKKELSKINVLEFNFKGLYFDMTMLSGNECKTLLLTQLANHSIFEVVEGILRLASIPESKRRLRRVIISRKFWLEILDTFGEKQCQTLNLLIILIEAGFLFVFDTDLLF